MPTIGERFTEFYIVGPDGSADHYPAELTAGRQVTVTVGIVNHEGTSAIYTVAVKVQERVIGLSPIISLSDGLTWEQPIGFIVPEAMGQAKIDIFLDRQGEPPPYRALRLLVDVVAPVQHEP